MKLPTTTGRVPRHTAADVNAEIAAEAAARVARCAQSRDGIDPRLEELDREWDVERALEANAATASLVGVVLGATIDRRFYALPTVVAAFLLQHAVQGWCPPLPVLRRLRFRTQREIDQERYALKALRGDFDSVRRGDDAGARALEAARA